MKNFREEKMPAIDKAILYILEEKRKLRGLGFHALLQDSEPTVRKALRRLVGQGYVVVHREKGVYVYSITPSQLNREPLSNSNDKEGEVDNG